MSPNGEMTVAVWAKVKASALTRRGLIIGNSNISPSGGNHMIGWGLQVVYPARSVRFSRGQPGGFGQPELYATTASGLDRRHLVSDSSAPSTGPRSSCT